MQNNAGGRRMFVCKHCGTNIDLRRRRADGSLQCPKCKVIYRPKPTQNQASVRRQPQRRKSGLADLWHSIPWKRKVFKLPVWLWVVIVLLALVIVIPSNDDNVVEEAPVATSAPTQEVEPTATTEPVKETSNGNPTLMFGELLSVIETPTYLFDENDNYVGKEDNIVVVKAKISPSYNNEATIKQNYLNIEDLIKNQGFDKYNELQYWAVADMTDGSEGKVFSCTVDDMHIHMIKNSSSVTVDEYDFYLRDDLWILPSLLE